MLGIMNDTKVAHNAKVARNERVLAAWRAGRYRTAYRLARAYHLTPKIVYRIISREEKRVDQV